MAGKSLVDYRGKLIQPRGVGAELSREFPRIAARLSRAGVDVSDAYAERRCSTDVEATNEGVAQ